jgi:hypothetical protein
VLLSCDDPHYTCFVGIIKPKGVPSGGGQAGMVFKYCAEQTFVKANRLSPEKAWLMIRNRRKDTLKMETGSMQECPSMLDLKHPL